ncbi:hypothetical protein PCANC_25389 [Puccinia coronata f. sp. avenae]|uniref:Uncharacterized protein n=1 Tax=Puccinia coronata f. sp. avenae TaxID=200324 RepID=A0A2N5TR46_9BASI|nr:hypothetical protein PCANC_25389 [Puccinia coronata f. sp. avenae]
MASRNISQLESSYPSMASSSSFSSLVFTNRPICMAIAYLSSSNTLASCLYLFQKALKLLPSNTNFGFLIIFILFLGTSANKLSPILTNNPSSHTSVTRSGGTTLSCSGTAVTPGTTITPSGADVAVTNSTSRKRKSAPSGAAGANDAFEKRKSRKAPGAEEYKDVCRGNAITNRAYLSKVLGKMFLNAGGNSRGWPGKNTNTGLAEFKLKLVIKKNKIDIDSHLRNVPISRMKIEHT